MLLGLLLATGLWLVLAALRTAGGPSFTDRIAPQLRSVEVELALLARGVRRVPHPADPLAGVLPPLVRSLGHRAARRSAPSAALEKRLVRAGTATTVADFRAEQLLCAAGGLLLGALLGVGGTVRFGTGAGGVVLAAAAAAAAGWLLRDHLLGRRIRVRERRRLAKFPAVAKLMALSVGAGESAVGSLERVCRVAEGELTAEFRQVLA